MNRHVSSVSFLDELTAVASHYQSAMSEVEEQVTLSIRKLSYLSAFMHFKVYFVECLEVGCK